MTLVRADVAVFSGEVVRDLPVFSQRVDVWFRPDRSEIDRRRRAGLGAITDPDALRTLLALPIGHPVRLTDLHPLDGLVLDSLPPGAAEVGDETVTRQATSPVELTGLVKNAARWEDVQAVSLLRTHAPRLVMASNPLARRVLEEADPDIGVAVRSAQGMVVLRQPGSRWVKPSWQRWLLAEAAFAAWKVSV